MGKPTGFKEYNRILPKKEAPDLRVQHHREFVAQYEAKELNQQSARCMNCGVPFCHSGCPLGNRIPEFNDAVYQQQWEEAYKILISTNNFPEFTGRICPAPCESACVLGIHEPPVTIEEIERHIIEIAFEGGWVKPQPPASRTGKKVAIIGSGPAGLAAADQLNKAGHSVVVFERDAAPGGLLRYGIPDFKLDKKIVERRIQLMEEEGIVFQCNQHIGKTMSMSHLLREYHVILLACGSTVPRDLAVTGRSARGIHFAMDYLKLQNQWVSGALDALPPVHAKGKKVLVIGGGDTGSDCVGTANRQGAAGVVQLELLPQPPKERTAHMPWPTYPMLYKTTSSHEEGCVRKFAVATRNILTNEAQEVIGVECVELEWSTDAQGRPSAWMEKTGTAFTIECDLVLLAMGFLHPEQQGMLDELGVELDERGNIHANEKNYQTNISKVFAAGDARRGQSLVVWAISEGREAARQMDIYLMGQSWLPSKEGNHSL